MNRAKRKRIAKMKKRRARWISAIVNIPFTPGPSYFFPGDSGVVLTTSEDASAADFFRSHRMTKAIQLSRQTDPLEALIASNAPKDPP